MSGAGKWVLLGCSALSDLILSTPSGSSISWSGRHRLRALVKTDIWITSAAPTQLGRSVQPLSVTGAGGVGILLDQCRGSLLKGGGTGLSFTPGHGIWYVRERSTCPSTL